MMPQMMGYGMGGNPFGPPPMMNPYMMVPPAGMAAQFMPMAGMPGPPQAM